MARAFHLVDLPKELVRFVETRFASKIMMCRRYLEVLNALEATFINPQHTQWVNAQKKSVKDAYHKARQIVFDFATNTDIEVTVKHTQQTQNTSTHTRQS